MSIRHQPRVRRLTLGAAALCLATMTACSSGSDDHNDASHTAAGHEQMGSSTSMQHRTDDGPVPAGISTASNPKFPVGSKVTLTADHMDGMDGAPATVVGAYSTYSYAVDFTPTTGGAEIVDHKWVVQQEIRDAGPRRLADGTKVVLTADHMDGMDGAAATIDSSTDQTVYVVDYESDGMTMKNHKWVVEDEMTAAN
ncbi:YdhK family protein [Williamsia sterculiae]|uniref:DUF1541 domain-containing protein n=1 Tax=Williamsia sterculiae TaxID=1344003 RepID=A0A1N7HAY2_9NOCA|nr:YdhK family protein [Williamsia sterculiae]SIS22035.1 Protein of unknown function [Williamsia sterculiae]